MSRQPENPLISPPASAQGEFTPEERRILLRVAHSSIECAFENAQIPSNPPSTHLAEPRGAFTTIYVRSQLRGCVGYVFPVTSVYQTVAQTARAAAFEDTRFWPLTREEASELEVSLSILSPLTPIQPEQVEVGRHGLLISHHGHRGLLLPQVPIEHHWDRITFLEQTCRKAGLPSDTWTRGASIEAFMAEVFCDSDFN